jgi:hypothetical protein
VEVSIWVPVLVAIIAAIPGIWGVIAVRRSHQEERTDKQAVSAISGFADLVRALENRLERSHEEIEHAEEALGACRSEIERMRRVLLAFQHGGVISEDDK